jgi:twinkle protein
MARTLSLDTIDFAEYERSTEVSSKVVHASEYTDDLIQHYALKERGLGHPTIMSKLRSKIEFRPGEVTVWAGHSGHRKSTYLGQVVVDLLQQSHKVLVASMEMLPISTLDRMTRQACGVRWPSPTSVRRFSEWNHEKLWLLNHTGEIAPAQALAACRYFADKCAGQHVVLDSWMMICNSEEHLDEHKRFATSLCRAAQEFGIHIHIVAHCRKSQNGSEPPPSKHDVRGSASISDQASNVITVWMNKEKKKALEADPNDVKALAEPDHYVTVEKQRNGEWEGRAQFWFDSASMRFCDDRVTSVQPIKCLEQ